MQTTSDILFLHNNEIDKQQWDECINTSSNGLIYARFFYLDNVCPGWKALTGENYEWVFPITYKTKFGISYLYQPPFTQQLGVFAKADIVVPFKEILHWLKQHYNFWEIHWNYTNKNEFIISPVRITAATNFILHLSASYESIAANFHSGHVKALQRSKRFKLIYKTMQDYDKCIDLYRKYYGQRIPHVKESDYKKFSNICEIAAKNKMLQCRQVMDNEDELLSAALLLYDGRRLYNIINITTETGRQTEANHFLLDSIIKEFSGRELLFDFEGSDLPGVKTFYKNFGAVNQPYFMLQYNNLPWPFKLFKKQRFLIIFLLYIHQLAG